MKDWKETTIGEIADVQTGPFGSQLHEKDYVKNGTPIVTVEHLGLRKFKTQNLPLVSDADKNRLSKYILCEGDIVFSRVGSVDRCTYTSDENVGWMFSGRCLRVRANDEIDSLFLYYYFNLSSTKQFIRNIAVGATMPSINTALMCEVPVKVPPLPTQQKIAAVLSALDDKLELNRQINANLEQQAQAIFKNWFVDFEPFGGQMPSGWRMGKLSEILAEIETGRRENGGALSCGIPSIGAEKIENITYYDFSTEKYISQDFYQKMTKGKIKSGDVLLYKDGAYTGKSTMFLNDFPYKECAVNEHVFLLRTAKSKYQCFLYLLISQKDTKTYLHTMASSKAAQPGLNKTELQSLDIIIPTNDVLDKFEETIRPLFTLIIHGLEQSRTLASIRDTLLPKLMCGEIEV